MKIKKIELCEVKKNLKLEKSSWFVSLTTCIIESLLALNSANLAEIKFQYVQDNCILQRFCTSYSS
ncbi:hypothetical protein BpHYR1_025741, partial [Brachionus plicatilis]